MSRIWVTLTAAETDEANRVGLARHMAARERGGVHTNYSTGDRTLDLLTDQKAARAELAGHIGLKTSVWNAVSNPGGADLDGWIDVKERSSFDHFLNLSLKAKPQYAYVSVCSEKAPDYCIDGWCYGHEIMLPTNLRTYRADRKPMYGLNPCLYVPPIKTPQQLMAIVQRKLAKR